MTITAQPSPPRSRRPDRPLLLGASILVALATHDLAATHAVAGLVAAAVLAGHVRAHRRWLAGVARRVRAGRCRRRVATDLALALAVLALAVVVVLSGLALLADAPAAAEVHGASAAALVLAGGWHAVRHGRRARRRGRARKRVRSGAGPRAATIIAPE